MYCTFSIILFLSSKHHQLLFHPDLKLAPLLPLKKYNQKAIHNRIQKMGTFSKDQHYFALAGGWLNMKILHIIMLLIVPGTLPPPPPPHPHTQLSIELMKNPNIVEAYIIIKNYLSINGVNTITDSKWKHMLHDIFSKKMSVIFQKYCVSD